MFLLDDPLARFDRLDWMTTDKSIWFIAEYLCEIPHISLLTPAMQKILPGSIAALFKLKCSATEEIAIHDLTSIRHSDLLMAPLR